MSKEASGSKINHILKLMGRLARGEEMYVQDPVLLAEFGVDERTMRRYLKEIHQEYSHIVLTEKIAKEFAERKVTVYRVADRKKDVAQTFAFFLENSDDLGWLLQLVHENDPSLLQDSQSKSAVEKLLKQDKDVFLFKSSPFENIEDLEMKKIFATSKNAVKNHEYRKIVYHYRKEEIFEAKCMKMIYMSNNWYLAIEVENKELRLLRLTFIKEFGYSSKSTYQPSSIHQYDPYFKSIQNPMTLNKPMQTAHLKASPNVALYFEKNMKLFFPTQKYIGIDNDGNVEFTIDYTQELEILPFIKQWIPDLTIVAPDTLKNTLLEDLAKTIKNYPK